MTTHKRKAPGFLAGLIFLSLFTFAMGALGVYGWVKADGMDQVTRVALAIGAGITALVIPFTVIVLGRSRASFAVIPVLILAMGMQAVSFHNFVGTVIEAPHKAAFDLGLKPLEAEVSRTTLLADNAQVALDAFPALKLPECLCPKTTAAKTASWEAQRAPLSKMVETTDAKRLTAVSALATAKGAYSPMIPEDVLWIVGGLLDISIALAIWAIEMTRHKIRKETEARLAAEAKAEAKRIEKREQKAREYRAKVKAERDKRKAKEAKAAKVKMPKNYTGPYIVAANDR